MLKWFLKLLVQPIVKMASGLLAAQVFRSLTKIDKNQVDCEIHYIEFDDYQRPVTIVNTKLAEICANTLNYIKKQKLPEDQKVPVFKQELSNFLKQNNVAHFKIGNHIYSLNDLHAGKLDSFIGPWCEIAYAKYLETIAPNGKNS